MERKITTRIIAFNLIITSIIFLDLTLPGKEQKAKEIDSIYTFTEVSGQGKTRTADQKNILELTTGERYRIGRFPDKEYIKNTKIIMIESALSNNINQIKVYDKEWKKINIGLFSNLLIFGTLLLSTLITLINIFKSNKILNIGLILSMMFNGIIAMIYHFIF
ncbi:MAG: hypothetical protein A3G95_02120 [Flavobacteria bacterium RIFCSPLOWO2_12_FULL_31_7]|nr:MAG: hypothetical protein A3G95_02120 [Flavobacteria bacterium RIFCSPLOWO2_12_FULL_31_7]